MTGHQLDQLIEAIQALGAEIRTLAIDVEQIKKMIAAHHNQ